MASEHDLVKTIELLLKHMESKGMILGIKDRQAFIQTIAQNIMKADPHLSAKDMLDPKFQKTLSVAILSQHISDHFPSYKFDYGKLFQFDKHDLKNDKTKQAEAEQELKLTFKVLLTQLNKLTPENKRISEKELDALAGLMAKKGMSAYLKQEDQQSMQQSNTLFNLLMEPLAELSSRQLFGGINPKMAGSIVYPVQVITGNLFGITDQVGGNENSNAFIDALFRYDGQSDPLGIERANLDRLGDMGVVLNAVSMALTEPAQTNEASGYQPMTPFKTTPKPPGTVT